MTVATLKAQLLDRELPIDGLKAALLARLLEHLGFGDDASPAAAEAVAHAARTPAARAPAAGAPTPMSVRTLRSRA